MIRRFIPLLALSAILLFSCTVTQEVDLNTDGSGQFTTKVAIHPAFYENLETMAVMSGQMDADSQGLFDVEKIKADIEQKPGLKVKSIESPDPRTLIMTVTFDNIDDLLKDEEIAGTNMFSFTKNGTVSSATIEISRDNFTAINSFVPEESQPMLDSFGPASNEGISEEEYLEMMDFVLENAAQIIGESAINTKIKINGTIIEQNGGTRQGNTITYTIPLIDVLLLAEPLKYSVKFK